MNKKKTLLLTALLGLGAITQASFVGIVDTKTAKIKTKAEDHIEYTEWMNKNLHYDCLSWNPDESTVNLGDVFTQLRDCSQDQERTETVYNVWSDGSKVVSEINIQEQTIIEEESQSATGTKNFTTTERIDSWGSWYDITMNYDCLVWTPAISTIDYGLEFTQSRICSKDQERNRDVYDVWADGSETLNRTESEYKTISDSEMQQAIGTKNLITNERIDEWGEWTDINVHYDCSVWTPDSSTIDVAVDFTQTRDCLQDQERNRDVYDVWADGSETLNRTESENQSITEQESQVETGTRNDKDSTRTESWSDWEDEGSLYACSTWSPNVNTVNHGTTFTQSANCSQNQERNRDIYDVWTDGSETLNRTETDMQTISVSTTQSSVGTKDYIVGTTTGSWSNWTDAGSHYDCGSYSPTTATIDYGQSFTQNRSCKQNQTRTRTIYDDWKVGSDTVNRVETDNQTINENESRNATGTKNYQTGTSYGSWSSWSDVNTHYECGSYSPATSTINLGQSFTQTRSCKQDQERTRPIYKEMADGSKVSNGTDTENQTINENETRSATGTKNYITGTSYGSWNSWVDTGSHYNCGSYTPAESTINYGQSFTQTRSCKQDQLRTRTVYNDWADGSTTVKSTESENQTINENETRSATGTKNYITGTSYGSWSGWSDNGAHYNCGSWSPATSTINSGQSFTQTRSCKQNQTRTRTVYNDWADGSKTAKSTETGNQTINENESRQATGTKPITGTWKKIGSYDYPGCASNGAPSGTCTLGATYTQYEDGRGAYGGCLVTNWECQ